MERRMSSRSLFLVCCVWCLALLPPSSYADETSVNNTRNATELFKILGNPQKGWTLNHICVLEDIRTTGRFTISDFVEAVLEFARVRWESSKEAVRNQDKGKADFLLGYLSHTIIDLHWPERIERSTDGMIVGFRNCEEFGGGQGIQKEESSPSTAVQNDPVWREAARKAVAEVFKKYKDERPFEEVAFYLRHNVLRIAPGYENKILGAK